MLSHAETRPTVPLSANGIGLGKHKTKMPDRRKLPETPAMDEIRRLQTLRDANGGYLVPRPDGIDNAHLRALTSEEKMLAPTALMKPSDEVAVARQWFEAIIAEGGFWYDLFGAYCSWKVHPQTKEQQRGWIDAQQKKLGIREAELHRKAELERAPWQERQQLITHAEQEDREAKERDGRQIAVHPHEHLGR